MRLLVHEWCCSGGLSGPDGVGTNPASADDFPGLRLYREGRAMLEAIAADAARDPSLDLTVLVDECMLHPGGRGAGDRLPEGARRLPVRRGGEIEAVVAAARDADWTIIVAPETDGILASRVAAVRAGGGRVLAPDEAFLAIAADKQATADALAAAGVAVPAGRPLAPFTAVPTGFRMPAVRKARSSAGCDGILILRSPEAACSPLPTRLEALAEGTPVGVAMICGPGVRDPLPPFEQRFSAEAGPRYLGGLPLADAALAERAVSLADHAVAAVMRAAKARDPSCPGPAGWVGVDMILGSREDGSLDRVLEVNPRLTTSFVGLSVGQHRSLVTAMIETADGRGRAAERRPWLPGEAFTID